MKHRFAIAGYGYIGKRYEQLIQRNTNAELVAICDTQAKEIVYKNEEQYPFYNNITDLLAATDFDILAIATSNKFHAPIAIQALESGKHVIIEKPMGLSVQECQQVIDTANRVGKQVFCVMQNRYSPPSAWLKETMDSKKLGDIYLVQVNCYWNRGTEYYTKSTWKGKKELDGGTLFTQFSHFVDIMYWVLGEIKDPKGTFANFNHQHTIEFEDTGSIHFEFKNGGIGTFNYSTSVFECNLESSMTIIGSKGTIKIGGQYMNEVSYCNIEGYTMPELAPSNPANDYGTYKGSAANHEYIIQNAIETLEGKASPTTNALEGLKVVEIIEQFYSTKNV